MEVFLPADIRKEVILVDLVGQINPGWSICGSFLC